MRIKNTGSKPDNIIIREHEIKKDCRELEDKLPNSLQDYFTFLNTSVSIRTREAYLKDLIFFFNYLINSTTLTKAMDIKDITIAELDKIKARDINRFLGDYCTNYTIEDDDKLYVMTNDNRSISRKKSSLSVFFKFLFREELVKNNISTGFNPIKIPKLQPDSIKKLEIDEIAILLDAVDNATGLTENEKKYWEITKWRDRAIIYLFVTYGLRISELRELNISSFNFSRLEFTIFRKRGKEVKMPLNKTIEKVIKEYLENYRNKQIPADKLDEDALFLSIQNNRLGEKSIRNLVKKYTSIPLKTTRKKGYSPHKLRASVASSLIEYGFSIYDVQNLLDHDNVTTTQIYATHKKNAKRDIVANNELIDI